MFLKQLHFGSEEDDSRARTAKDTRRSWNSFKSRLHCRATGDSPDDGHRAGHDGPRTAERSTQAPLRSGALAVPPALRTDESARHVSRSNRSPRFSPPASGARAHRSAAERVDCRANAVVGSGVTGVAAGAVGSAALAPTSAMTAALGTSRSTGPIRSSNDEVRAAALVSIRLLLPAKGAHSAESRYQTIRLAEFRLEFSLRDGSLGRRDSPKESHSKASGENDPACATTRRRRSPSPRVPQGRPAGHDAEKPKYRHDHDEYAQGRRTRRRVR